MLMSQAAMAASSIGLPRLGVSAREASVISISADNDAAEKIANLDVNMLDLPIASDAPTGDRVVVLIGKGQDGRRFRQLAARGDEFGAGRLHIARFIPRPALQRGWAAVPAPRHSETGEGLAQPRFLKCRLRPPLPPPAIHHYLLLPPSPGLTTP